MAENLGILIALGYACTLDWGYTWRTMLVLITLYYAFTFLRTALRRLRSPPPPHLVTRFAEYVFANSEQQKELDRLSAVEAAMGEYLYADDGKRMELDRVNAVERAIGEHQDKRREKLDRLRAIEREITTNPQGSIMSNVVKYKEISARIDNLSTRYLCVHNAIFATKWWRSLPIPGLFKAINLPKLNHEISNIYLELEEQLKELRAARETGPNETDLEFSLSATLGQSTIALRSTASSLAVVIEKMRRKAEGNGAYSLNEYQMDVRVHGEEVRGYHALSDYKNKVWAELLNTNSFHSANPSRCIRGFTCHLNNLTRETQLIGGSGHVRGEASNHESGFTLTLVERQRWQWLERLPRQRGKLVGTVSHLVNGRPSADITGQITRRPVILILHGYGPSAGSAYRSPWHCRWHVRARHTNQP